MGEGRRWRPGPSWPGGLRNLPDDQASLRLANAYGARDSRGNSIAQGLKVRALDVGDEIEAAGHRVNLGDHRVVQLHAAQFDHQLLYSAWFGRDEHVRGNHSLSAPFRVRRERSAKRLLTGVSSSPSFELHQLDVTRARYLVELMLNAVDRSCQWKHPLADLHVGVR